MTNAVLSLPQLRVLRNIRDGEYPHAHLVGMSAFGGHTRVMKALYAKGLIERYDDEDGNAADRLTTSGREALQVRLK